MNIFKKKVFLAVLMFLFIIVDVLASIWFFIPQIRTRILDKIYLLQYPYIPQTEFNRRIIKNDPYNFVINNRAYKLEGIKTTIVLPDGSLQHYYEGTITGVPEMYRIINFNATKSSELRDNGSDHELRNRLVAIIRNKEIEVFYIPKNVVIVKNYVRSVSGRNNDLYKDIPLDFNELKEGNFIRISSDYNKITVLAQTD